MSARFCCFCCCWWWAKLWLVCNSMSSICPFAGQGTFGPELTCFVSRLSRSCCGICGACLSMVTPLSSESWSARDDDWLSSVRTNRREIAPHINHKSPQRVHHHITNDGFLGATNIWLSATKTHSLTRKNKNFGLRISHTRFERRTTQNLCQFLIMRRCNWCEDDLLQ